MIMFREDKNYMSINTASMEPVKSPNLPKDLFKSIDKSMAKGLESHLQAKTEDFRQQSQAQAGLGIRDLGMG